MSGSHLQLESRLDGLRVKVNGCDLNEKRRSEITAQLLALADERGPKRWFLDLDGLDALQGSMLTSLLRLDRKLRAAGGRLSLRNVNPLTYEIFHICRLTDLMDPASEVAESIS
jgi:anti-anti-sigma factor